MLHTHMLHAELHHSGCNSTEFCCAAKGTFSKTVNVQLSCSQKQGSISAQMAYCVLDRLDIAHKAYKQNTCWLQAQKEAQKEKAKEEKEQQRLAKEAEKERLR